jgi:hypothetical protein
MSRPATGHIETKPLADGSLAFHLRFTDRAHGRQRVVVHSRHRCSCAEPHCEGGGWSLDRAREILDELLLQ